MKKIYVIFPFLFFLIHMLFYFKTGVQYGSDSPRYINGAQFLLSGQPLEGSMPSYIGYILFVSLLRIFSNSDAGIVFAHIIFSTFAFWFFLKFVF